MTISRTQVLADMMRPANTRTSLLLFVGGSVLMGVRASQIVLFGLLIVLLYAIATIGNDLRDQNVDNANNRCTPLTTGAVTSSQAVMVLGGCLALVAFGQSSVAQPVGALFTLTYLTLAAAYSAPRMALEDRGLIATFLLATCYFVLPLWLAIRLGGSPHDSPLAVILLSAGLLGAAGVLYKDFKDEVGDRLFGKRTPLVRYGARAVVALSVTLAAGGAILLAAASHRRLLTSLLLLGASCALARMATRPGKSPGGLQLYYLLAACALLVSL